VSLHRYPPQSLFGDYMRAGLGLLLTVPPLLFFSPGTAIGLALVIVAGVCMFFVVRTVDRNRAIISVDDDGISLTSFRNARVAWAEMARMNLAYYAIKRDKTGGWMELTLKDAKNTIKLDSRSPRASRASAACRSTRSPCRTSRRSTSRASKR
jgi:hypothetical protein